MLTKIRRKPYSLPTTISKQFVQLFNRSNALIASLNRWKYWVRDRDAAIRYNTLREDVKRLVNDPGFDRTVPPVWYLKPFLHIPITFLSILAILGTVYLLTDIQTTKTVAIFGGLAILLIAFYLFSDNRNNWILASNIGQIQEKANLLRDYLVDYIKLNPNLGLNVSTADNVKLERELNDTRSYNLKLEDELNVVRSDCERLRSLLAGLETPSKYEVPQQVLNKLDSLEQTKLLEAVQAYRVNAWTPAAAVCGMILEGRLQQLCNENDIRPGGIGEMIRRLGEAGLLKGYYKDLAKVGEFFRHRASHPTSEEFDREKATLVLTSLIILIRDSF